jgi:hypothetical protein
LKLKKETSTVGKFSSASTGFLLDLLSNHEDGGDTFFRNFRLSPKYACHLLLPVPCLAYTSTLTMEAVCSSETLGFLRSACATFFFWFPAWLIFRIWRWKQHVPPKRRLTCNSLHGIISQKRELFKG